MTDHLRAGRVGNAPELGKVTFRRRVAVAVKSLRQKAARRLRAVVHGGIGRRIAADGQKVRRADGIVKRFEPFFVAEHVPFHAGVHGNPPGIRRLEPPHFSQKRRDVLRLRRPAVRKRKRAVDADPRRIHARRQTGADHLLRRVFSVAKDAVRVEILHPFPALLLSPLQGGSALPRPERGQYHIQFLNQFIRASHSRETSSPDA